jgi:hypothetical protein
MTKTGTCPTPLPCCALISISSGLSWYCNCDKKDDAACDADIKSKTMSGAPAWRVPACPAP